jgi:hypothetical protein
MAIPQNRNLIERYFWQKAIPLLTSGNRFLAGLVRTGDYVLPRLQQSGFFLKAIFWACIGLLLGLGIGVLIG